MDRVGKTHTNIIRVHPSHMEKMRAHVDSSAPEEACGILGGCAGQSYKVIPVENVYHSPVRFRMEPQAQWNAFQCLEREQLELIGNYHSHPSGPGKPSLTDIRQAYYPEAFYLIWFRNDKNWECSAFRIENGAVSRVKIILEAGAK